MFKYPNENQEQSNQVKEYSNDRVISSPERLLLPYPDFGLKSHSFDDINVIDIICEPSLLIRAYLSLLFIILIHAPNQKRLSKTIENE
jgi:hypothetical protein